MKEYADIITTYLAGLRAQSNVHFDFDFNPDEYSVCFTRYSEQGSKITSKLTLDRESTEEEPPLLKNILRGFQSELKDFLAINE